MPISPCALSPSTPGYGQEAIVQAQDTIAQLAPSYVSGVTWEGDHGVLDGDGRGV